MVFHVVTIVVRCQVKSPEAPSLMPSDPGSEASISPGLVADWNKAQGECAASYGSYLSPVDGWMDR